MEITLKKTVEETITINFPHYTKNNIACYKVISEFEVLAIEDGFTSGGIIIYNYLPSFVVDSSVELITEKEFNEKYIETLNKIKNLI